MPDIKLQHVVSCSSEDTTHKADNLLKPETYRKWKGSTAGERQVSIILQFEKASEIHSIDVGNEGSAFIEILVGSSTSGNQDDFQVILVSSSFMSPAESKNGTNTNRVRMFGPDKLTKLVLNKKWDRAKIVCSQPFNKHNTYGLSFVKFHSPPKPGEESSPPKAEGASKLGKFRLKDESQTSSSLTPGSYFKKREEVKEPQPLTGAAAVRAASTLAATSKPTTPHAKQSRRSPSPARKQARRSPSPARKQTTQQKRRLSEEQDRNQRRSEERDRPSKPPPVKKRKSEASEAPKQSVPFKKLMSGVTFVLSGYQNPFRGDLRDKAIEMGAKYKPDWGPGCTHLICAFANTPKYNQVKGKGKIVTKQWIMDSHRKKMLMPWRRYKLSSGESSSEEESYSEEEEEEEEDWEPPKKTPAKKSPPKQTATGAKGTPGSPSKGKSPMKKTTPKKATAADDDDYAGSTDVDSDDDVAKTTRHDDVSSGGDTEDELRKIQGKPAKDDYGSSTDEESDGGQNGKNENQNNGGIPELPDFFSGKSFFMYGKFDKEEKRQVNRFVIAFGGVLEDYMKDDITYVITNSSWDDNFDQALTENASLAFVKPKWLYKCNEKAKLMPYQPYVVIPN